MSRRRRGRPSFLPAPSSDVVVLCGNGIGGGGGERKGDLHYLLVSAEEGSGEAADSTSISKISWEMMMAEIFAAGGMEGGGV